MKTLSSDDSGYDIPASSGVSLEPEDSEITVRRDLLYFDGQPLNPTEIPTNVNGVKIYKHLIHGLLWVKWQSGKPVMFSGTAMFEGKKTLVHKGRKINIRVGRSDSNGNPVIIRVGPDKNDYPYVAHEKAGVIYVSGTQFGCLKLCAKTLDLLNK